MPKYLVNVTRSTLYSVTARNAEEAKDKALGVRGFAKELDQETLTVSARKDQD